ncbi:hypothetical protein NOV72_01219 [Caballeronia novacaledonica]|uniref:DUF1835 domain-containing protein n=1 Tax=Caballeronia novacaledonica TaxID=1544861 RepID=A0A2U3I1L8_9BURK|nr:DUF1835 domain-containing protein [Caballeronia novacaledonica]SPB13970.1 hypothetical protein NOV72_01219 [Caballeronia novacaledonica]
MNMIHVTNGDCAAQSLTDALRRAERDERVIVLRDDLAVGPIRDIDESPLVRATFWRQVMNSAVDFEGELEEQQALFGRLARGDDQIVVWHGQSASDQLTLRRVAYHLRNAPQRLNEAKLTHDDLTIAADESDPERVGRADRATAVGMFSPKQLLAKLPTAAPISVLRISRLALEWQEAKYANAETRRLRDNMLVSGTWIDIDEALLDLAGPEWKPAREIAGAAMAQRFDFMLSDAVAFWRCRELVTSGRLKIRGTPSEISQAELRR